MGYKNIMISNPIELHIKNQQLIITEDISFPMEDINCILIENMKVQVSAYLLQKVAEWGIAVIICDEKHIPNSVVLPIGRHSRHFKMLKTQIGISKPFQKRLWQQIVIRKILNQAKCLEMLGNESYKKLEQMSKQVQSGDITNVEAKAAAFYFRTLFGCDFSRGDDNIINAALNYSYAVIRGIIARTIICYGFEPSIGLFHHSELNAFNLADDFIEPIRPLVDYYVASNFDVWEIDSNLTPEIKRGLFSIINYDMDVEGEKHSISNCVDKMIMSFSSCLMKKREKLLLPDLLSIQVHRYE